MMEPVRSSAANALMAGCKPCPGVEASRCCCCSAAETTASCMQRRRCCLHHKHDQHQFKRTLLRISSSSNFTLLDFRRMMKSALSKQGMVTMSQRAGTAQYLQQLLHTACASTGLQRISVRIERHNELFEHLPNATAGVTKMLATRR